MRLLTGQLIIARQQLAHLLNFESFAHKTLSRKVLKTPQQVQDLLLETAHCVSHQAETEADLLRSVKASLQEVETSAGAASDKNTSSTFVKKTNNRIYSKNKHKRTHKEEALDSVSLSPWDESYLINSYKSITDSEKASRDAAVGEESSEHLGEYLSMASCMNGLRFVCAKVFGIHMKYEKLTEAEVWTTTSSGSGGGSEGGDEDLLKCSFTGPQGEALGYIYFDLYTRAHKFTGAAHFTIRCGCSNTTSRPLASSSLSSSSLHSPNLELELAEQQLPVVALVFNFPRNANLSMQALETLYHEMGHALHSLLSRTKFQHLSGTRGSTDFVEVRSEE